MAVCLISPRDPVNISAQALSVPAQRWQRQSAESVRGPSVRLTLVQSALIPAVALQEGLLGQAVKVPGLARLPATSHPLSSLPRSLHGGAPAWKAPAVSPGVLPPGAGVCCFFLSSFCFVLIRGIGPGPCACQANALPPSCVPSPVRCVVHWLTLQCPRGGKICQFCPVTPPFLSCSRCSVNTQ